MLRKHTENVSNDRCRRAFSAGDGFGRKKSVQGTVRCQASPIQHVRADHRRGNICVPQKLLDRADVLPPLQQMRCTRMAQRAATGLVRQPRLPCRARHPRVLPPVTSPDLPQKAARASAVFDHPAFPRKKMDPRAFAHRFGRLPQLPRAIKLRSSSSALKRQEKSCSLDRVMRPNDRITQYTAANRITALKSARVLLILGNTRKNLATGSTANRLCGSQPPTCS